MILAYYGDVSNIPNGFKLCDGSNGTPDLRGRTIIGTGVWNDSCGSILYNLGDMAGEREHQLTIAEMPSHNHSFTGDPTGGWNGILNGRAVLSDRTYSGYFGYTDYVGGNQPHNNMQPYYVLYYIMKV